MIAELGLGAMGLATVAALWWCARRIGQGGDRLLAEVEQRHAFELTLDDRQLELERVRFELAQEKIARAEEVARRKVLENAIAKSLAERPDLGEGLAPDDVDGHLQRIIERAARTTAARGSLPPGASGAVPAAGQTRDAGAAERVPSGRPDV